jgi:hypothetical protein
MYPRNAASPERIAIGPVVQISDGAVQTSGCTVRIIPLGVAEGDGGGTTAYSTDGVVLYTPTQAETNYTSFVLIAKKSGCIPASITVVTTASATPGIAVCADTQKVDVNTIKTQSVTAAAGVTVGAYVGGTGAAALASEVTSARMGALTDWIDGGRLDLLLDGVKTKTDGLTFTGADVKATLDGEEVTPTAASKTGYTLTATTGLGNQTANITGNLSGSVGSVTGAVGSVTGAVGSVTGAVGSIAANGITATSIAADAINAAAVKADAVTKIQTGLATPTNITAGTITTVTNLTNLPAITAGWLTATGIATGAITNAKFAAGAIDAAAIANGAIDAATFAADVDAEILSYIVDDATRIDASSLNTAAVTTVPAINTKIGTPANIDSGGATIADNLKKIADDNGGASFDATVSSLNKLSTAVTTGVPSTLQATANTETTGTLISGTFASTYLSNGTSWVTAPVTPAVAESGTTLSPFGLNANLLFTAGATQTVNSVSIRGNFAAGPGRYVNVYAYNYATASWDMLSDTGTRLNNSATLVSYTFTLLSSHQKPNSGGDGLGAIRIGFKSPSTTTGDRLNIDQCLVNVATANPSTADIADAVYAKLATSVYGGKVCIDTVNGVDGYAIGTNGLEHTPVLTIACAYQLCDDLKLKTIAFTPGSNVVAVQLTRSAAGWEFVGPGKIDLNGANIADAIFTNCYSVYGTSTGDDAQFNECQIGSGGLTLDHSYVRGCRIKGAITLIANAEPTIFQSCIDATGAATDFELIFVASATAVIRDFQGAVTLKSMAATNSVVIDGACRVTIDGSCTAGSITLRGFSDLPTGATGNTFGTSGTITQTARYAVDQINAQADTAISDYFGTAGASLTAIPWNAAWDSEVQSEATDALNAYDPPTNAEMELRTLLAANYGTAANQTTILGYVDCLPATWVVPGTLTAAQVRTELATELGRIDAAVSTRQATVANLANAVTMAAQFATMVVLDGAVYDYTAAALAAAPSGTGLDAAGVRGAIGMATANMDTQLSGIAVDAATAAGASGGSGARTVVITVNDSTTALESARVRVTKGALSYALSTSVAGIATFNLDDGTWVVSITLAGYTYAGTSLVVNGDETATYSMTANAFTPSTRPDTVTLRYTVIDDADYLPCGAGEATVKLKMVAPPPDAGLAWGDGTRSDTTDANGVVEFAECPVGATYKVAVGATPATWPEFTIPIGATSPYDAGAIIGKVP